MTESDPILHVMVVGFHHKRGCQVEFAYPPLGDYDNTTSDDEVALPERWKHLPSLALPDGAHNFEKDTVYFHIPSLDSESRCAFGVACHRQIATDKLRKVDKDVTRSTVQKSVCVLSRIPLFGYIETKLEIITQAYFREGDFRNVLLLRQAYDQLNEQLRETLLDESQVFLGLSAHELVVDFHQKALTLFKMILLEKKVFFFSGNVRQLTSSILSLLSLFPEMVEYGLYQSTHLVAYSEQDAGGGGDDEPASEYVSIVTNDSASAVPDPGINSDPLLLRKARKRPYDRDFTGDHSAVDAEPLLSYRSEMNLEEEIQSALADYVDSASLTNGAASHAAPPAAESSISLPQAPLLKTIESVQKSVSAALGSLATDVLDSLAATADELATDGEVPPTTTDAEMEIEAVEPDTSTCIRKDEYGFPLDIFSGGSQICYPYLSLSHIDLLYNPNASGFVVGATNVLFLHQHRKFADILVDLSSAKIEIYDVALKKQLNLSTEDLRFAENISRVVNAERNQGDVFDGTGWEGGEEWIRHQFRQYLLTLFWAARNRPSAVGSSVVTATASSTTLSSSSTAAAIADVFNPAFISAWKRTRNYRHWTAWIDRMAENGKTLAFPQVHPGAGEASLADWRNRASYVISGSERGRKLNNAVHETGKAVAQSGRAFGGAISSWWSGKNRQGGGGGGGGGPSAQS